MTYAYEAARRGAAPRHGARLEPGRYAPTWRRRRAQHACGTASVAQRASSSRRLASNRRYGQALARHHASVSARCDRLVTRANGQSPVNATVCPTVPLASTASCASCPPSATQLDQILTIARRAHARGMLCVRTGATSRKHASAAIYGVLRTGRRAQMRRSRGSGTRRRHCALPCRPMPPKALQDKEAYVSRLRAVATATNSTPLFPLACGAPLRPIGRSLSAVVSCYERVRARAQERLPGHAEDDKAASSVDSRPVSARPRRTASPQLPESQPVPSLAGDSEW